MNFSLPESCTNFIGRYFEAFENCWFVSALSRSKLRIFL